MEILPLAIPGAYEIRSSRHDDARGYFLRAYDEAAFASQGLQTHWVQHGVSHSVKPFTLRGLHFQYPPMQETKLVRCVQGVVWDVCVDMRKDSPRFGQWVARELSAAVGNALYIPKGCAHGFCTLTPDAIVTYLLDASYSPEHASVVHYADPDLAIDWPTATPVLSDKDAAARSFAAATSDPRLLA